MFLHADLYSWTRGHHQISYRLRSHDGIRSVETKPHNRSHPLFRRPRLHLFTSLPCLCSTLNTVLRMDGPHLQPSLDIPPWFHLSHA
jgi:hypothetical protein